MRMALYHPWTYLKGGIERVLLELLERSRHDWTLYTHHFRPDETFPELSRHDVVVLSPAISVRRSLVPLLRSAATIATARLPDDGARALLVSSDGLGDLVIARNRLPAACYCHTPLKILHDPVTRAALRQANPAQSAVLKTLGPAFAAVDRRSWRRFRHAFANSRETAGRLAAARLRPAGPIEVLHPGVDTERFRPGPATRARMFLVAGRIMWQKQIELAVDAFTSGLARGLDAELVIAGAVDEKSRPYLADLRERAAGLPVRFEVDPSDDRLVELYGQALAVVFTAPNEDWGIVPLEAMACGTPVLAVDRGGPRESVVDGGTGWLLPPRPDVFADRLVAVAACPEALEPMRRRAREHVARFSWQRFVERVDTVMEALARGLTTAT